MIDTRFITVAANATGLTEQATASLAIPNIKRAIASLEAMYQSKMYSPEFTAAAIKERDRLCSISSALHQIERGEIEAAK